MSVTNEAQKKKLFFVFFSRFPKKKIETLNHFYNFTHTHKTILRCLREWDFWPLNLDLTNMPPTSRIFFFHIL